MIANLVLALLTLGTPGFANTGGEVPNGGDTVLCTPAAGSPYKGYYSLDYLLTLREDNSDLVNVRSWDESKQRLLRLFDEKSPDLARLFRDYLSRIPGEDVTLPERYYMEQRMWIEAPYGLLDIKDERMVRKLPPNCYKTHGSPDEIEVIQTVIRQPTNESIVYNFDPAILRTLKQDAPQQYSFLIVHEWLWDYIHDVEIVRRVNRFLHTNSLERLNAEEIKLSLQNLGFNLKFSNPLNFCQRTPQVRSFIESVMQKPCTQITEYTRSGRDDYPRSTINVKNSGITTLKPGDFSGLGVVSAIDISNNQIDYLFEDLLSAVPNLGSFEATGNQIKKIPKYFFASQRNLSQLSLRDNQIEELPPGFFSNFKYQMTTLIDLSNNKIKALPEDTFKDICALQRYEFVVLLRGNPIKPEDIKLPTQQECPTIGSIYIRTGQQ